MKKKICLLGSVGFILVAWILVTNNKSGIAQLRADEEGIFVSLQADNRNISIKPWLDEEKDVLYFFLPAFIDGQTIILDHISAKTEIDDIVVENKDRFEWEQDKIYRIRVGDRIYKVTFMKSENLPAFFLNTGSGSMEYIHSDKRNKEHGELSVVNADGHLQYRGLLDKVSGRGNSTWGPSKKPYTFTLQESEALCGIETGKKWNLLALFFEQDKIHTKIILDMGRKMGLSNTPECTWVDLYCNGEYRGLYLLTEAVAVADQRVDIDDLEKENRKINGEKNLEEAEIIQEGSRRGYKISNPLDLTGGYLIEKNIQERVTDEDAYFSTAQAGYVFTIKNPQHASLEEVNYIADFVQNIENMLIEGDDKYKDYLDVDSFSQQFLVEKIAMDIDGMKMSTFFYKEKNEEKLYAGPIWDYDKSAGQRLPNYETPIEGSPNGMEAWYMVLYQKSDFYNTLLDNYRKILPYMDKVINEYIDYYADKVNASVAMDRVLMRKYGYPNSSVSYTEFNNSIRYLKYFLANRLNYLNSLWDVSYVDFSLPKSTGEYHKVVIKDENGEVIESRLVIDGECIDDLPPLDSEKYRGWYLNSEYSTKEFSDKIPIYEDMVIEISVRE